MTPAAGISACIIARDESAVLSRCFESLRGICSEICLLDTGSRDDTVTIARSLGAIATVDTSCNGSNGSIENFSQARNIALELVRTEWVLQIDADEVLLSGHDALSAAAGRNDVDVLGISVRSGDVSWMGTRFFRRNAVRGYAGRVHERLDHSARFAAAREIVIENRPDKRGKESSSSRNLRLLRLEVSENPNDGRAWYYLGQEERRAGDSGAAILAYARSIEAGGHVFSRFSAPYHMAVCCFLDGRFADAMAAIEQAIIADPRFAEGHCLRGDLRLLIGDHDGAVSDYRRALSCGEAPHDAVFAVDPECYREYPRKRLYELENAHGGTR